MGAELEQNFDGQAANLVAAAKGSAVALVNLVTQHFPGMKPLTSLLYFGILSSPIDYQSCLSWCWFWAMILYTCQYTPSLIFLFSFDRIS